MTTALRDRIRAAALRFADDIATALEVQSNGTEWVDQNTSPLGKRRHLALVRSGTLLGTKEGRKVLVRRSDIDAYLVQHPSVRTVKGETADDVLTEFGLVG